MTDNPLTVPAEVQAYINRQPSLGWRRAIFMGIMRAVIHTLTQFTVTGQENVPRTGPTILMMNHIAGIDPGLSMAAVRGRYVVPMSKSENFEKWYFAPFLWWYGAYAIRRGEVDREALLNSIALLKSGAMILIAPEGTRNPDGMVEAKEGLAYLATKADAIILPTAIAGAQHFKSNVKQWKHTPIRINFGPPFRLKTNGRARVPRAELTQMTREAMYQLALAQTDPALRGVYSDVSQATTETLEFVKP
ncbi:MAG: 1-acyl-sn-glycerol-3-phosphate acyltransferase [Anaerolineae bacterium]|jgi:1-acyl-sn-glycerol-3-phosphate acyltransferase|nr:1-acyl-sn-glycerol-3-phosphate acyltransferase [Anaerolineae bacterium]